MKRLALALFFTLACTAHAADWIAVHTEPNSDQYFYDRSKLFIGGDEITYWKKVTFRTPQPTKNQYASSGLYRERINCAEHTLRLMSYLLYASDGSVIEYVANHDGEPSPVIPDTLGDLFEKKVCPVLSQKQEEQRNKRTEEERKKTEEAAKKAALPVEPKNVTATPAQEKTLPAIPAATAAPKEIAPSLPAP